jgi:hypothetical protein
MSETHSKVPKFIQTQQQCYYDRTVSPGEVFDCCFHPKEPVLACGLSAGIIRLFRLQDLTDASSSRYNHWTLEHEFHAAETESHVSCMQWNVSWNRDIEFETFLIRLIRLLFSTTAVA